MFRMDFSIIALIGVFLLIGIVKKNAILIIDFALEAERTRGLSAVEAVREACLLRFRPILMTTLAAALGALPLAIGFGEGAELRRPLGVAIIGGLIASQVLTLLTTPVVYVLLDKLRRKRRERRARRRAPRGRRDRSASERAKDAASQRSVAAARLRAARAASRRLRGRPRLRAAERAGPGDLQGGAGRRRRDWLPAAPADTLDRGDWWRLFDDAELNRLAAEVDAANQNVAAAVAAYAQAQALVREARAAYFPSALARRRARGAAAAATAGVAAARPPATRSRSSLGGDWEPDLWGRVGRAVEARAPSAQASAADLAAARLSAQGELAIDYFALREADAEADLLAQTIEGYERALQITQNRYAAGVVAKTDVLQAQTQLATTRAIARGGARQPRALRARDRGAHRQGAGRLHARRRAVERGRAGDAARRAVRAAAAPARHRLGRAPGRRRQRADRRRARRPTSRA